MRLESLPRLKPSNGINHKKKLQILQFKVILIAYNLLILYKNMDHCYQNLDQVFENLNFLIHLMCPLQNRLIDHQDRENI